MFVCLLTRSSFFKCEAEDILQLLMYSGCKWERSADLTEAQISRVLRVEFEKNPLTLAGTATQEMHPLCIMWLLFL